MEPEDLGDYPVWRIVDRYQRQGVAIALGEFEREKFVRYTVLVLHQWIPDSSRYADMRWVSSGKNAPCNAFDIQAYSVIFKELLSRGELSVTWEWWAEEEIKYKLGFHGNASVYDRIESSQAVDVNGEFSSIDAPKSLAVPTKTMLTPSLYEQLYRVLLISRRQFKNHNFLKWLLGQCASFGSEFCQLQGPILLALFLGASLCYATKYGMAQFRVTAWRNSR